jgi:hypothetical protein
MFDINAASGRMPTVFSARDERVHKRFKRSIAGAYTMSSLKELEPMNDDCSAIFLDKMEKYADKDIDLGKWVHVGNLLPCPFLPEGADCYSGMRSTSYHPSPSTIDSGLWNRRQMSTT